MLFGKKSQPLLGLDITTSSVKLIELSQSGKRYRVESYSAEPTPPSSVSEKAIVDGYQNNQVPHRISSRVLHRVAYEQEEPLIETHGCGRVMMDARPLHRGDHDHPEVRAALEACGGTGNAGGHGRGPGGGRGTGNGPGGGTGG